MTYEKIPNIEDDFIVLDEKDKLANVYYKGRTPLAIFIPLTDDDFVLNVRKAIGKLLNDRNFGECMITFKTEV